MTKPFKLEGDKLMINADAHGGDPKPAISGKDGVPLPALGTSLC